MIRISIVGKTRGIGYVVCDDEGHLLDWKVSRFRGPKSKDRLLDYLLNLIHVGDIAEVILPDMARSEKTEAGNFLQLLHAHLCAREVSQRFIGKAELRACFGQKARYAVALALCAEYPELSGYLPKKKRLWESEDASMLLFDAAAQMKAAL